MGLLLASVSWLTRRTEIWTTRSTVLNTVRSAKLTWSQHMTRASPTSRLAIQKSVTHLRRLGAPMLGAMSISANAMLLMSKSPLLSLRTTLNLLSVTRRATVLTPGVEKTLPTIQLIARLSPALDVWSNKQALL